MGNVEDEETMAEHMIIDTPGDVHWDLERIGKIPPIYYGMNSQQIGWVAGKEWWYRKSFIAPTEWKRKTIRLRFDGVDYLNDRARIVARISGSSSK